MTAPIAYYNEFDKYAAQWLRNLIDAGHIAPGIVDERDIRDVRPDDLHGFTQCHFFAGIGVWSLALRRANWADDRAIWTASCPCQPFSQAGEGAGFADERHLWPHLYHLIEQCRPAVVLGEQVASKDADPWLDLVHTDLEALGYAFGAVAFPSAGVGAPHIRDRTYWVANANDTRSQGRGGMLECAAECSAGARGMVDGLADHASSRRFERVRSDSCDERTGHGLADDGASGRLGDAKRLGAGWDSGAGAGAQTGVELRHVGVDARSPSATGGLGYPDDRSLRAQRSIRSGSGAPARRDAASGRPGSVNGLWRDADWLACRDGKWRPVEPGTFPLAHGAPARVGRLRAYGNAVNAEAARVWIETVMDCLPA